MNFYLKTYSYFSIWKLKCSVSVSIFIIIFIMKHQTMVSSFYSCMLEFCLGETKIWEEIHNFVHIILDEFLINSLGKS